MIDKVIYNDPFYRNRSDFSKVAIREKIIRDYPNLYEQYRNRSFKEK